MNDSTSGVHLVLGADGMIGGSLMDSLQRAGRNVVGTVFLQPPSRDGHRYLDLSAPEANWDLPADVRVAYLCAGVGKLEDCRRNPEASAWINVHQTTRLAQRLVEQGAFVLFLSTTQVFDGSIPNVPPLTPHSPSSVYGRQKAEAETFLRQWPDKAAVVRLTKVLGFNTVFQSWSASLRAGEAIRPFSDMVLSPIPLTTVVSVLRLIGDVRQGGVWQISGERDVPYAEAALWLARNLGVSEGLVQPRTVAEAGIELETNQANTTLNTDRLREELGLEPPPVQWTIRRAFGIDSPR